jgi:hypothetical protein
MHAPLLQRSGSTNMLCCAVLYLALQAVDDVVVGPSGAYVGQRSTQKVYLGAPNAVQFELAKNER